MGFDDIGKCVTAEMRRLALREYRMGIEHLPLFHEAISSLGGVSGLVRSFPDTDRDIGSFVRGMNQCFLPKSPAYGFMPDPQWKFSPEYYS